MSILGQLEFVDMPRAATVQIVADPKVRTRNKLIAAVDEQIAYINGDVSGVQVKRTVKKYEGKGDERVAVEKDKRLRKWYFETAGTYYTELRYGTRVLHVGKQATIKCGPKLESVLDVLEIVKQAVSKGELDKQLAKASVRVRQDTGSSKIEAEPEEEEDEPVAAAKPLATQQARPVPKRGYNKR